jgi:dTDP-4-amino-4,6-dideoxygalactose transaminase
MGCFSFNGNKVMTTGGGGMIVTDDDALARRAKHLTTQARLPGLAYRHDEVGYNYRLSNVAAALGLAQLEQLPRFLRRKREIARAYDAALSGLPGLSRAPRAAWSDPSMWLYSTLVRPGDGGAARDRLIERLGAAAIEARPIWSPLHTMPMFASHERLGSGAVAESIAAHGVSLPCSVGLTEAEQERVVAAIRAAGHDAPGGT